MRVEVGRGFDIVAERSVMFSYIVPTRVLEFDATPSGQIGFAPVVRVDDKEDPYFVVINDVTHEVAWAIAYLTTLAPSSSTPPADLRAVLEV